MAKYVIVGGVAGGAGVAARLRRLDEKAEILLFERGEYVSYANCGLPYYAGGTINERDKLFLMTPEKFKTNMNIDVFVKHEVVSVNPDTKSVKVKDLATGKEFDQVYDSLVLSPGASPIRPPIPGIEDPFIMSLRSVPDVDRIKAVIDSGTVRRAVVVGGGFIGLEMAENLHHRGLAVTLIEALDQVMNVIDYDMAAQVQQHLRDKGVALRLKDGVASFERRGTELVIKLASGLELVTDLVILSIGVRPDTGFIKNSGIDLAQNGAIKVDEFFNTSVPGIKAVGDAIEFKSPLLGVPLTIPLAGPANKQARICAENIVLKDKKKFAGAIGTSIAKVFDMTVAATGLSEKNLDRANLPYTQAITHAGSHAGYYPGATQLTLKILYQGDTGKIWGAQAVGYEGIDKRIDVIAAFIQKGGTMSDLAEFEQAYAPPFSSAKDPINMTGFIAENVQDGITKTISWREVEKLRANAQSEKPFFLDVRTPEEFALGAIPGAYNIPHTQLRARYAEVPKDRTVIINCAIGLRGYLADRMLRQNGFTNSVNLCGGYKTWKAATSELDHLAHPDDPALISAQALGEHRREYGEDGKPVGPLGEKAVKIDACGLQCPGPIIRLKKEVDELKSGDRITIQATDPGFARDVKSWCSLTGNELVSLDSSRGIIEAVIQKKGDKDAKPLAQGGLTASGTNGATLIVFSNDLDKALASFVLANGAAATGKEVTMFFTFWGLSVLRKKPVQKVKKDFMGSMFGMMLPKGMKNLALSSMNFGGMGASMMKGRMKSKNVDQVESMFAQARMAGVRMVACQMSMDIMGITQDELLDGVEIGGVATYMEAASMSGINLFV